MIRVGNVEIMSLSDGASIHLCNFFPTIPRSTGTNILHLTA